LSANGKVDRKALPEPGSTLPAGPARPLVGAVESYVAELFGQILDREVTDSKADFFALGGTSFGALRLVSGLELRFDRRISLSALFDGASVAKVAELVGAGSADQHTALVPIATGAAGPPLVLIHPVGGNLLCYSELLAALDYPGPVYGCQSAGLSSPAERDSSIEQMAERYVAELLSTVAAPTIRLAGWSMGGVLAVAMARLLGQHGREVDRVVLIDAEPASEAVHQDGEEYWIGRFLADLLGESEAVADTDVETALRRAGLLSPTGGIEELAGLLAVFKANTLALHRHQTTDYAGPVLLIRAAESAEDNAERWRQYLPELAVAEVEAGHYTMMTGSRVRAMANIIGEFFDTAGLTERIR
jgi:thioesterase domain-containing protein/acyl carrier protein